MHNLHTLQFHYRLNDPSADQVIAGLLVQSQHKILATHGFLHFFTAQSDDDGRGLFVLGADSRSRLMLKFGIFLANKELAEIWFSFLGRPFYTEYTILQVEDADETAAETFMNHCESELKADTFINRFTRCDSVKDLLPFIKLPE